MNITIKYFSWIRVKLKKSHDLIELDKAISFKELKNNLISKDPIFQEIFKDTSDAGSGKSRQNVHKMWIPTRQDLINTIKEVGFITYAQVDLLMAQLEYQYLYVFQKPE